MVGPNWKTSICSSYRQLLRLIRRLPDGQRRDALKEAHQLLGERKSETNPEQQLKYFKELQARIGFLRITTPRAPGDGLSGGGNYVLRDGQLVNGSGAEKGSRVADGTISKEEAFKKNEDHFKRFYGKSKPKSMFF